MDSVYKAELQGLGHWEITELIPERKALLVSALRSGKYIQGIGALARLVDDQGVRYCCLGVGCEISGVARFKGRLNSGLFTYLGHTGRLPASVCEWYGFGDNETGVFTVTPALMEKFPRLSGCDTNDMLGLTELNDVYGWTFKEIADLIDFAF